MTPRPPASLLALGAALSALSMTTISAACAETSLPPDDVVRAVLEEHPSVVAAKARTGAAEAEARALRAGPHEVTANVVYSRRKVDLLGRYNEVDANLMRTFRLPGKARLDRRAGHFGITAAENRMEDVRHQTATQLADLWWDWLGASAEAAVDRASLSILEHALTGVRRRVGLRDASVMEGNQAEAAVGNARLVAEQSGGRAELARARLLAQFPTLPLPAQPGELPLPVMPEAGFAALSRQVVERSHEISAATAEAEQMRTLADRARRDRLADPSLGVRVFNERGGHEKGFGLIASIPFGGRYRSAVSDRAAQESLAADAQVSGVRANVQEMAEGDRVQAEATWRAWKASRTGMEAQVATILKMRQGYKLGAVDLFDLLLAERLTQDAFRAEASARTEALRAITRLRIDSHNLWIGDAEDVASPAPRSPDMGE